MEPPSSTPAWLPLASLETPPAPDVAPAVPESPVPRGPGRPRRSLRGPLALLVVMLLGWLAVHQARRYRQSLARDLATLDRALAAQEATLASVALLQPPELAALRAPAYRTHLALAERLGVSPLGTKAALRGGAPTSELVTLATTDAYRIAPARYSVARATPDAAAALDSIGARFGARLVRRALPHFGVVVTSVLRSGEDQEELRRVNPNAAAGASSHEYGVSFDLAYRRYVPVPDTALAVPTRSVPPVLRAWARARRVARLDEHAAYLASAYPARLDALLGRTLLSLKRDSVLVVLRERRQPVYHVTVARRLVPRPDALGP